MSDVAIRVENLSKQYRYLLSLPSRRFVNGLFNTSNSMLKPVSAKKPPLNLREGEQLRKKKEICVSENPGKWFICNLDKDMRISYDPSVDALYIRFIEGPVECEVIRLNDRVAINVGPEEQVVGLEILDATERFWPDLLSAKCTLRTLFRLEA
jgi:uncharacterized protein YuzE